MTTETLRPKGSRMVFMLLSTALVVAMLYIGREIIFPLLLALFLAVLLRPVVVFLHNKLRIPNLIAILLAVIFAVLIILGLVLFISHQVGDMANDWMKIKENLIHHFHRIQKWILDRFNVSYLEQDRYLHEATKGGFSPGNDFITTTLVSFKDVLMGLVLIPVYTFLFLLYRTLFISFLLELFSSQHREKVIDILMHLKGTVRSYLFGLLTEMCIVATLTGTGFMIVGVNYAILLGVITGLMNMIPYIGITIASLLSVVVTLTSSTQISMVIGVILVNVIVQFFDNNVLVPLVVSSKVRINALVSIVGIWVGGAIAGVAGMFLAIPVLAVMKVIFDRVDFLKPWGLLLGDDMPKTFTWGKIRIPSLDVGSDSVHSGKKETHPEE